MVIGTMFLRRRTSLQKDVNMQREVFTKHNKN